MRYQELDLLFEHNVVNIDAIQQYVGAFARECKNPIAAEWFTKTLARHLEQDDDFNTPMDKNQRPLNAPPWLDAALERGDDIRVFREPTQLTPVFDHLVDYFNYLAETQDPILNDRRRVLAVTVPVAIKKSQEWVEGDAKKAARTQASDVKIVAEFGPYAWVEPTSVEAIFRDGKILQNCLGQGTYHEDWESGANRLFFLHDSQGQPHVAIRTNRLLEVQEAKGKQNKPPVGRYIGLTAQFINETRFENGTKLIANDAGDIRAMGLVVHDGLVGTASSFGTVVFKTNGLQVVEVEAQMTTTRDRYGSPTGKAGGGKDYWFVSPKEGDLFAVNHDLKGKIFISDLPEGGVKYRAAVQDFLNNYFEDTPLPEITDNSQYGRKNAIDQLNLPYDYLARKYGTTEEVSQEDFRIGDYTGYLRGVFLNHRNMTALKMIKDDEAAFSVVINKDLIENISLDYLYSNKEMVSLHSREDDFSTDETLALRPVIIEVLNHLKLPPMNSYDLNGEESWRSFLGIFYNAETKTYGDMKNVAAPLWSKNGITAYDRHDTKDRFVSYMKGKTLFLEFKHDPAKQSPQYLDRFAKVIPSVLLASLNDKNLSWTRDAELMLDRWDVFTDKSGKWTTREKAGEKIHTFDDGAYFTIIDRGADLKTYTVYDGDDKPLSSIDLRNNAQVSNFLDFDKGKVVASRYYQWLLNSVGFEENVVDGGNDRSYGDTITTKMHLWHMGLFHDTKSDSWKLIQDGKMLYDGGDWRAVNFRNRVFVVDNQKGILGWFKKDGQLITEEHVFPPFQKSDLYARLTDLARNTEFEMPPVDRHARDYTEQQLNKHGYGFHPETNEFGALADHFPEKTVAELPKGEKWVQRALDDGDESGDKLHHNRFSLVDKNEKTTMRVEVDDDHVSKLTYYNQTGMYGRQTSDFSRMPELLKKKLIVLMEKLNLKLNPTRAKEFGFYRTSEGRYKPLRGNKALEGYLDGNIKFSDGHEFRFRYDTWELGIPDYTKESWEQFQPYIKVKLDDEGIESVSYLKKSVKRNPKEYMPYIHKLMQIFSTIAGDQGEE